MKNKKGRCLPLISAVTYGLFAILAQLLLVKSAVLICQAFQENPDGGYTLVFSPNIRAIPYAVLMLLIVWTLVLCILRAIKVDFPKAWFIVTSVSVAASMVGFLCLNLRRMIYILVTTAHLGHNVDYLLTSPINILNVTVSAVLIVEAVTFVKCI